MDYYEKKLRTNHIHKRCEFCVLKVIHPKERGYKHSRSFDVLKCSFPAVYEDDQYITTTCAVWRFMNSQLVGQIRCEKEVTCLLKYLPFSMFDNYKKHIPFTAEWITNIQEEITNKEMSIRFMTEVVIAKAMKD